MKLQKVFKVVRRAETCFFSWFTDGQARVEYRVGEWAEPPKFLLERGYGLIAFKDRDAAIHSISDSPSAVVFEADFEYLMPLPPFAIDLHEAKWGRVVETPHPYHPNPDEVMVRRIRLLRPIAEHRICYVTGVREGQRSKEYTPVFLTAQDALRTSEDVWCASGVVDLDKLTSEFVQVLCKVRV